MGDACRTSALQFVTQANAGCHTSAAASEQEVLSSSRSPFCLLQIASAGLTTLWRVHTCWYPVQHAILSKHGGTGTAFDETSAPHDKHFSRF